MASETRTYDDMTEDELTTELYARDWNVGDTAIYTTGVVLTFRKHYTAHVGYPGVETRTMDGENDADAIRKFLVTLDNEHVS
jgi:hypothetical protein